jgi:hypothetical protein
VKARNFACLLPVSRSSLNSAESRHALIFSMLSQTCTTTRGFGFAPSIEVTFCPAARMRPPEALINA